MLGLVTKVRSTLICRDATSQFVKSVMITGSRLENLFLAITKDYTSNGRKKVTGILQVELNTLCNHQIIGTFVVKN